MRQRRSLSVAVSTLLIAGSVATASLAATPQPTPHPAMPQPRPAVPQPHPVAAAPVTAPDSVAIPPAPDNDGKAWILMDYETGQVLASKNPDQRIEPASLTKIMTSYVVAAELAHGKIDPNQPVAISERAWKEGGAGTDGSFSAFDLNSKVPLMDVQRGLIIQSGNDAALALAEHVAGSVESFVALMNSYAAKLGMKNTHYANPHGLSDPQHYTTVRDISTLARALIHDYPAEYAIYKEREYTYNNIRQYNRNELLGRDSTVDGIKTGHTSAAGFCLAASAKRGDQRLISVVAGIDAKDDKDGFRLREDSNLALLNWGFRFFETHPLYQANVQLAHLKVWKGKANDLGLGLAQPVEVVIPRGRYSDLKPVMDVPKNIVAPIARGQRIGTLRVTLDGKPVIERPLIALTEIPEAGFFGRMWDDAWMWWEG
ncbi:MAG TPA: serine hydrolase [Xanthomonadaceae bacterium]|jgi:D-alanyl-D-alanine carboxypeptidase (penicillin-binding protein 5/6)|nr:serine hydrolase [Xanthomonadaceae bacterium]